MSYFKGTKSQDANKELIENYGWSRVVTKIPTIAAPPKEEPEQQDGNGRSAIFQDKETTYIVGPSVTVKR